MQGPTFSPLTEKERVWLDAQLGTLPLFVEAYAPDDAGRAITLSTLDRVFAAWSALGVRDNIQVNAAINIVGIRFGQFLVDEAGFSWVIATDKAGSELAVLALPDRGDVLIYPANFVAKRWERGETDFLVGGFEVIRKQIAEVQSMWSGGPRRPWWRFW